MRNSDVDRISETKRPLSGHQTHASIGFGGVLPKSGQEAGGKLREEFHESPAQRERFLEPPICKLLEINATLGKIPENNQSPFPKAVKQMTFRKTSLSECLERTAV